MRRPDPFTPVLGSGRTGGVANKRSDDPPPAVDTRPPNTSISYLYRDADNYKSAHTVILAGRYEDTDLEIIRAALDDGMHFIPSQVGLLDLQGALQQYDTDRFLDENGINDSDHAWHELNFEDDPIALTNAAPTEGSYTFEDLLESFKEVVWDETAVDLSH